MWYWHMEPEIMWRRRWSMWYWHLKPWNYVKKATINVILTLLTMKLCEEGDGQCDIDTWNQKLCEEGGDQCDFGTWNHEIMWRRRWSMWYWHLEPWNYVKKAMINVILTLGTMKLCEEGDDQCDIGTWNHEIMWRRRWSMWYWNLEPWNYVKKAMTNVILALETIKLCEEDDDQCEMDTWNHEIMWRRRWPMWYWHLKPWNYVKKTMINVILELGTMKLCEEGDDQCDIGTWNHEIMWRRRWSMWCWHLEPWNYVKKAMINVILELGTMKLCEEGDDQCDIGTWNHKIMWRRRWSMWYWNLEPWNYVKKATINVILELGSMKLCEEGDDQCGIGTWIHEIMWRPSERESPSLHKKNMPNLRRNQSERSAEKFSEIFAS